MSHPDILPRLQHSNTVDQFRIPFPVPLPVKPDTPNIIEFLIKKTKRR
jgi:hypothetical protein